MMICFRSSLHLQEMDKFSRAFKILNNSSNITLPVEETACLDITFDSDDDSTTYLDLQPFTDSPDPLYNRNEPEGMPNS